MIHDEASGALSRRTFLKYAGGAILVAAATGTGGTRLARQLGGPARAKAAAAGLHLELGGTDGWISLPQGAGDREVPPGHVRAPCR